MPLRTNPQASLGQVARQRALDHIHNTGKFLAATIKSKKNSIVNVEFQQGGGYTLPSVTIPAYGPEYTRNPYQKGDKGIVLAADMFLGQMNGLGPDSAPGLSRPGNLSPLVFLPIGNQNFSNVDPDKINHYGKTGATMSDQGYQSVHIAHYKDQQGQQDLAQQDQQQQPKGFTGWARGKPQQGFDPANIDPTKFDHFSVGNDSGITHSTKGDHNVSATGDNSNSNVTAKKSHNVNTAKTNINSSDSHNVNSPTSNYSNPNGGDHQQNINGNSNITKTLSANKGQFGSGGVSSSGGMSAGSGGISGGSAAISGQTQTGTLEVSGALNLGGDQYLTPVTGATITLSTAIPFTFLDPAAGLATLTLAFPALPNPGDVICVSITRSITTLTCSGGTFGVNNPTTAPASGAQWRWKYVGSAGKWLLW